MGGGNYDSLAEYLNGEWHFDVDPELIDTGGFYGEHGQGGYVNYDQFGTTNRLIGFGAASGMLIPVFREWNEIVPVPPGDGDTLHGWEVIHHTEFLGFRSSATYRVTSLSDPQDWLGRLEGLMDGVDIAQAYAQLLAAAEGDPNTFAMGQPFISQANGMLMAEVSLNGVFIGHVQVNDNGFSLFDINGNVIGSELPLTQHWNEIGGVSFMEERAHLERTMNIPFAQALVGLGTVFTGGMMSFLGGLGFGLASGVVTGGSAANATAYARLLEAAYELRRFELRNR